jgi:hypothetical protein
MSLYDKGSAIDRVLLKGYVYYKDGTPVQKAIVILEQLDSCRRRGIHLNDTTTNCYGEFCFYIEDRTKSYKIKVFDNQYSGRDYQTYKINME